MKKKILLIIPAIIVILLLVSVKTPRQKNNPFPDFYSNEVQEEDLFEEAVECIKQFEGWHSSKHYPYVGWGHKLKAGEIFTANISKEFADSLLRVDLLQKCSLFRHLGCDSLILGVLAYNVGEYRLLGNSTFPKSKLIQKLDMGDRDIYQEYISFRMYKGKVLRSLEKRRKTEYELLFNKVKQQ